MYHVVKVNWQQEKSLLKELREKVFVYELNLPKKVEFDKLDEKSIHAVIIDSSNHIIGTGRLSPNGLISRVAIIKAHRNRQAYCSLLNFLVLEAKQNGLDNIFINCVLDEVKNFVANGFTIKGNVYMEGGIPRQPLSCPINTFTTEPFTMLH